VKERESDEPKSTDFERHGNGSKLLVAVPQSFLGLLNFGVDSRSVGSGDRLKSLMMGDGDDLETKKTRPRSVHTTRELSNEREI